MYLKVITCFHQMNLENPIDNSRKKYLRPFVDVMLVDPETKVTTLTTFLYTCPARQPSPTLWKQL